MFPQAIPPRLSTTGFRHFFTPLPLDSPEISIRGLGVRELMPPSVIERPQGMGDYLLMLFHDVAVAGTQPESGVHVPAESLVIWPPGSGHFYGNRAARYSHTWIHCEGARIRHLLKSQALPMLQPIPLADPAQFQQCLLAIHGELMAHSPPDAVIVGNLLENCLREIARSRAPKNAGDKVPRIPPSLLAVRVHIGSHSTDRMTLADMARMAGLSIPYFCAQFKYAFQLSPVECLIQHRMLHAAHLLADHGMTVSEIAQRVGYDDVFHFSKMFKKHFGASPRAFRTRGQLSRGN